MNDPIGKTIAGCTITEFIDGGGMGKVYKAHHIALDEDRAIKVMNPQIAHDEMFMKRFQSEARSLARAKSPHIVTVHDLAETEIGTCIVMEYVKGKTLDRVIRDSATPLEPKRIIRLFAQILRAFEHAHAQSVIHRDVKPSNIMITPEDTVKVADFGLAKIQSHSSTTMTQFTGGTIYYMSPEQLEGLGKVDMRSDIYSIGMTLYEALTGRVPFERTDSDFGIRERIMRGKIPPPREYNAGIPKSLNDVVAKAIASKPSVRFQSAAEMRLALEKTKGDDVIVEKRGGSASSFDFTKTAISISSVVLLSIISYLIYQYTDGDKTSKQSRTVMREQDAPKETTTLGTPSPPVTKLAILSEPGGARVELNGEYLGTTPIAAKEMLGGEIRIRLSKKEYQATDTLLALRQGDSLAILMYLKHEDTLPIVEQSAEAPRDPPMATLDLTLIPSSASVWIDGVRMSGVPPYSVKPGKHMLKVISGRNEWEERIPVSQGIRFEKTIDFTKKIRVKVFAIDPEGEFLSGSLIILDDDLLSGEETPTWLSLPIGVHTIEIQRAEFERASRRELFESDRELSFVLKRAQK